MRVLFFAIWVLALLLPAVVAQEQLQVGRFSAGDTSGWAQHPFVGETRYSLTEDAGRRVLAADSDTSASAFYREIEVDLDRTPVLNWSWRVRQRVEPDDETRKAGDDFSARVYVVRSGGLAFWNTRAINYVWSFRHARGESWDNPFAGSKARMLAIRDASDQIGEWRSEKRNIAEDFHRLFGFSPDSIDGVAIMTDTDNTGQSAGADYGDIYFTAE